MIYRAPHNGFIALISSIVISFVLLVSVLSLGQQTIHARLLLLTLSYKEQSERAANACLTIARITLLNNPSYTTEDRAVFSPPEQCTFSISEKAGGHIEIFSRAQIHQATTNLFTVVDALTGEILLQEERVTK